MSKYFLGEVQLFQCSKWLTSFYSQRVEYKKCQQIITVNCWPFFLFCFAVATFFKYAVSNYGPNLHAKQKDADGKNVFFLDAAKIKILFRERERER